MAQLTEELISKISKLEEIKAKIPDKADVLENAKYYQDVVLESMNDLRKTVDELETLVSKKYWPFPTYEDLLYRV